MSSYTTYERRLIVTVLREKIQQRLRRGNGRCLLGVDNLTKCIVSDRRLREAGLYRNKSMSTLVLQLIRGSNLILEEWGHSASRSWNYRRQKKSTSDLRLIFSVEGINTDEDRGSLSTSLCVLRFECETTRSSSPNPY